LQPAGTIRRRATLNVVRTVKMRNVYEIFIWKNPANWLKRQRSWLVFGRYPVRISAQVPVILTERFLLFPQSFRAYVETVPWIRSRPLPSISFSIYYHPVYAI
jgi:hypothetical protein